MSKPDPWSFEELQQLLAPQQGKPDQDFTEYEAPPQPDLGPDDALANTEPVTSGENGRKKPPQPPEPPEWLAGTDALEPGRNEVPEIPVKPIGPQVSSWLDVGKQLGPITWDWQRWLAPGFLHILAGASGKGKSSLALRVAACYLLALPWPDGSVFTQEQGAVLWCECEGAQALNLQRAGKWGLPLDKLLCPLSDPLAAVNLDNPQHRAAIEAAAKLPEVKLIIVDSLSAALGPGRDENESKILSVMKFLATLARDTGKSVLVTHHLRKRGQLDGNTDEINLERLRGSSAIVQVSRLVWGLDSPDITRPDVLRLRVLKSNLDKFPSPIGFIIDDRGVHFSEAPELPRKKSELEKTMEWLRKLLASGPMKAGEVERQAQMLGYSWRTVKRAKEALWVQSHKTMGEWWWSLPANEGNREEEPGEDCDLPGF